MGWTDSELNIKCLLAKPIQINGIGVLNPLTIDKISEIGFDKYNQYLSLLCICGDDIVEMLGLDNETIIEPFDFIAHNCLYGNDDCRDKIMDALSLFLSEEIVFCEQYFIIGDVNTGNVLRKENYNFFIDVLKRMNCIATTTDKIKIKNDKEKAMLQKLQEMRAKYNKSEGNTEMEDIISSICCKHPSINLCNIGGLTIYQLIDQYKRLNVITNYHFNLNAILHGADSKDIKLQHWSSKL